MDREIAIFCDRENVNVCHLGTDQKFEDPFQDQIWLEHEGDSVFKLSICKLQLKRITTENNTPFDD